MICWEIVLSKGQQWDWFGDPFWRVQTLTLGFVSSLGLLVFRELRIEQPVVDFRPLAKRNFAVASIVIFFAYAVLYGSSTSLPALLQSLFGYDATVSGLALSPAGIFSVSLLPIVAFVLGRQVDARWIVIVGLLVMGAGCYWTSLLNLETSFAIVLWPRVVIIVGLSMIFAPINVAAYMYIPKHLRGAAVGLFSLIRNEGGERRHVDGPNHSRATGAVSHPEAGRIARSIHARGSGVFAAGRGVFHATDRRPGRLAADGRGGAGGACSSRLRRWRISTCFGWAASLPRCWWCWCCSCAARWPKREPTSAPNNPLPAARGRPAHRLEPACRMQQARRQ